MKSWCSSSKPVSHDIRSGGAGSGRAAVAKGCLEPTILYTGRWPKGQTRLVYRILASKEPQFYTPNRFSGSRLQGFFRNPPPIHEPTAAGYQSPLPTNKPTPGEAISYSNHNRLERQCVRPSHVCRNAQESSFCHLLHELQVSPNTLCSRCVVGSFLKS